MNKRSDTYQLASQLLWEDAEPGVKRQIMAYDAHLMLVKVQFQTGAIGSVPTPRGPMLPVASLS